MTDTRTKTDLREDARDEIIRFAVNAALSAREHDDERLAAAIEREAAALCKKWGRTHVPGLPATWPDVTAPKREPMF